MHMFIMVFEFIYRKTIHQQINVSAHIFFINNYIKITWTDVILSFRQNRNNKGLNAFIMQETPAYSQSIAQ